MKKKVVIIGGGRASLVISALKTREDIELSAVIAMSDSGGSSGALRKEFGGLPPGDILRAVLAMSRYDTTLLRNIFYKTRFENVGALSSHNIGNIFLTLATQYSHSFLYALEALHQALDTVGNVYPVTEEPSDLCVELSNGDIVIGEHAIDRPKHRDHRITRAWLQPTPMISAQAEQAITHADYIVIAPGSLYTSTVAALTVEGMMKGALRNSKATYISVVGNGFEANGEVGPTTLSEYIHELEQYVPKPIDTIIYNTYVPTTEEDSLEYRRRSWESLTMDIERLTGRNIVGYNFGGFDGDESARLLGTILRTIIT